MSQSNARYRFLMIHAFSLSDEARHHLRPQHGSKETVLMNHAELAPLLSDVDWDLHPGARATHGDWPVERQEEFAMVGTNRLPIVKEACESGRYNAIVLLGGGDPGFFAAREIGRRYGIPVTTCAHAQMHLAGMLGHKFSIVDISEVHNMQMYHLVRQYGFTDRCASIRNIDYPLPRPPYTHPHTLHGENAKAERGETSGMLEAAVEEAVAAIEEDGAEVIILGCSGAFWLQRPLQERLAAMGWEVPVFEGYRCAIAMAKTMVDLGVNYSGLMVPSDPPPRSRRRKIF
jgi:allantoin racemase